MKKRHYERVGQDFEQLHLQKKWEITKSPDELHKIDKWRIKLIQKNNLDSDKIDILNKEIGKCKEKLKEFEELVLQNN